MSSLFNKAGSKRAKLAMPKSGRSRTGKRCLRPLAFAALAVLAFLAAYGLTKLSMFASLRADREGMRRVPGGEFTMGTDEEQGWPEEKPAHRVRVDGFWMDETEVTNTQFRAFVEATGHVTTAEKPPLLEDILSQSPPGTPPPPKEKLVPGSLVFTAPAGPVESDRLLAMVAMDAGRGLAAPRRAGQRHRGEGRSPRRSRFVGRCRRLREVGGQAAADRGRVGVRRARRAGRQAVCLGR